MLEAIAPAKPSGRFAATLAELDGSALDATPASVAPAVPASAVLTPDDLLRQMQHTYRNGKLRGSTTHFTAFDKHFTWKRGELTVLTGWPNHGKSEIAFQLLLATAKKEGKQLAVFSPENEPAQELVDQWVETWTGRTCDPKRAGCLSEDDYLRAGADILSFVRPVSPPEHDLESVLAAFEIRLGQLKATGQELFGVLLDPWNSLTHNTASFGGRDDRYLQHALTLCKRFAVKYSLCFLITAHPSGSPRSIDGKLKKPDHFSLEGGRMWANRVDNALSIHRPDFDTNAASTAVELQSHKIKKQKLVGIPGMIELDYRRPRSRYYTKAGDNPFPPCGASSAADAAGDYPAAEPYNAYANLPASAFAEAFPTETPAPF